MADSSTPAVDLTHRLAEMALLAAQPSGVDQLLERALEFLAEVVTFDLAAVLELRGEQLVVRQARGRLANDRVRAHRVALSELPGVRRALESRRTRVLEAADHAHDGDPYDGLLDLPHGHSCMVVPLWSGDRTLGAITFDRATCGRYADEVVDLATLSGQIVALAMVAAEHAELLHHERASLEERTRYLEAEMHAGHGAEARIAAARAPKMARTQRMARQVAATDAPVIVTGETGSGKEVLARAIHGWSARRENPFVKLNCAAIPERELEEALFGPGPAGRLMMANGGTLLLEEVQDLPSSLQAKMLRLAQDGTFDAVDREAAVRVDVRIIAATHVDLEEAVAAGRFREDLYYHLAVFPLAMPPLRERLEDVEVIVEQYLAGAQRRTGRGPWHLSKADLQRLRAHAWPGNVRELVNTLERATILSSQGRLEIDLPAPRRRPRRGPDEDAGPWPTLADVERDYLCRVLAATNGKIYGTGGAAEIVGLKPSTLQSRMARLGVERPRPQSTG